MIEVNVIHDVDVSWGVGDQKEEDSGKKRKSKRKNIVSTLYIEIIYQVIVCSYSYFSILTY